MPTIYAQDEGLYHTLRVATAHFLNKTAGAVKCAVCDTEADKPCVFAEEGQINGNKAYYRI